MKIPKIEYECDLPDFFLFADWFQVVGDQLLVTERKEYNKIINNNIKHQTDLNIVCNVCEALLNT